jgi:two-component system, OmpR family, sensor kinase
MFRATYRQAESELLAAAELLLQDSRNGVPLSELRIPHSFFHRFGKAARDRSYWILWDRDGTQLASSEEKPFDSSTEVMSAKRAGSKPYWTKSSGRILNLYLATDDGRQLLVGRPLAKEYDALWRILFWILLIAAIGLSMASLVAWWMTRRIMSPIKTLTTMADAITYRNLDCRIDDGQPTSEMTQLAQAFNKMLGDLKQSFERQRQFTSDAAHELRTPISIILGQCDFSLSRDRTNDEYRGGMQTCFQASLHMKDLVDKLLEISRIDSNQALICRDPVDLANEVQAAMKMLEPLATMKKVCVTADISVSQMLGDKLRLRQIAMNLISNAIQYNHEGGLVNVIVKREASEVVLIVKDNGIGISQENLLRIRDRFFRVDQARTTTVDGVGLGLSLVDELVKLHGGTLIFESNIGTGTIATIHFPIPVDF